MLKDLILKDFIEDLSSNLPAPGGGSGAALSAAMAASLTCMVFNLTIGKKAYNEFSDEIKEEINVSFDKAEKLKDLYMELMEKDAIAFNGVIDAYKLPKETDEEKAARQDAIHRGYIEALEVPLELATKAYTLYSAIETSSYYGNKNAISDAGVAALMLQSSIESAVLNVKINLANINDEEFKQKALQHCNKIIEEGNKRKEEIMSVINSKI